MAEDFYSRMIANPVAKTVLSGPAYCYGIGSYVRVRAYTEGLFERVRPPVPVISVGNLSVGGTGKTPVTIDLAERLLREGRRVGILSRGYRRQSDKTFAVVSDGASILSSCTESGDEPYMMAQALPGAVVVVGKNRSTTAEIAVKDLNCDVLLLDDGFQHLRLRRDFDVLLLDYNEPVYDDALVPAGRLREPVSAIGRATHIVVSKVAAHPDPERLRKLRQVIEKNAPHAQLSMCRFTPLHLRGDEPLSALAVTGKKVVAMCGIARPKTLAESIGQLGAEVVDFQAHPDHHWYSEGDLERAERSLEKRGADFIVTTEKDFVRLSIPDRLKNKIVALVMNTEWIGEPPRFDFDSLKTTANSARPALPGARHHV